ncbi:hypothetical protein D3C80_1094910 [compost metagenome]
MRAPREPYLIGLPHRNEHRRVRTEDDLRVPLRARERTATQAPQHFREVPLFGRMLIQLGFFNCEDKRRCLRHDGGDGRTITASVAIRDRLVALRHCSSRKMLEKRKDESALEAMTLPVHRPAEAIVLEVHVRHWQRDWHLTALTPIQRNFRILIQATQVGGEGPSERTEFRHILGGYQGLIGLSHLRLERLDVRPLKNLTAH